MTLRAAFLTLLFLTASLTAPRAADNDLIVIGQWRTETTKSLVCGGEELATITTIAKRANAFYLGGAMPKSPEYEAYWSYLENAFKQRKCFVNKNMRHLPDALLYAGPESLEQSKKRFKVLGTTIEENGDRFPAFTMTTRKVQRK